MKKLIFLFTIMIISATAFCQAPTYTNNTFSGQSYPCFGFRFYNDNTATYDTTGWYVQSIKPITVYTYAGSPLNHISALPNSICVDIVDTAIYIKVLGKDSGNWYQTTTIPK